MPNFAYSGRTRAGQTVSGERAADTMDAAVSALRREQVLVAEREVAFARRPVDIGEPRRRDAIRGGQHTDRIQRVFAWHRLAVHLDRELTVFGADGKGAFCRHGGAYLRSGGKRTRVPAGRWRTPSSLLARATLRYSAGSP